MLGHAVSSKVQGTVKVRQFKKNVRNLNSTRILFCNPASRSEVAPAEAEAAGEAGGGHGRREGRAPRGDREGHDLKFGLVWSNSDLGRIFV